MQIDTRGPTFIPMYLSHYLFLGEQGNILVIRDNLLFYHKISGFMNVEEIRNYCLSKEGVTEGFPFNDTALVFKVGGKMFALLDLSEDKNGISLKCEPSYAVELRERHPEITAAYHFNKKHWNSVKIDGNLAPSLIMGLIDHSYQITAQKKEGVKIISITYHHPRPDKSTLGK